MASRAQTKAAIAARAEVVCLADCTDDHPITLDERLGVLHPRLQAAERPIVPRYRLRAHNHQSFACDVGQLRSFLQDWTEDCLRHLRFGARYLWCRCWRGGFRWRRHRLVRRSESARPTHGEAQSGGNRNYCCPHASSVLSGTKRRQKFVQTRGPAQAGPLSFEVWADDLYFTLTIVVPMSDVPSL